MDGAPAPRHRHQTAPADRVSLRETIGLGLGKAIGDGTHGTLHVLVSQIYNMTLGLDPRLLSIIVFSQRFWDAITDPFVGKYSDNFRSRWGRRRPLLLVAALPVALTWVAMWWFPRGASYGYLFWHLLTISLLFYTALTVYMVPWGGLLLEATDDYHERTRLAGIVMAFGFAAQIGSQWVFPVTQRWVAAGAPIAERVAATVTGVRWVSLGCGVLFFVVALLPVLLCRERLYAKVAGKQRHIGFWESWRAVRGNQSLMTLLWARCIFSFGYNLVGILGGYMYVYYVYGGDLKASAVRAAVMGSSFHIAGIITSLFVYPYIERRIGKRRTLQLAAGVLIFDCLCKIVLYQHGRVWWPLPIIVMNGISSGGVSLMCVAMLADIADFDEWQTGLRREALFNALLTWFEKAGNSVGYLLSGFVLWYIDFKAPGAQYDYTLRWMKWAYVIAPAAGALVTILLVRRYELSQDQVYEIKDELARRRAAAAGSPPPPAS
jgi:GPH family glycoside/pentoside/hexuronide:cation symporter